MSPPRPLTKTNNSAQLLRIHGYLSELTYTHQRNAPAKPLFHACAMLLPERNFEIVARFGNADSLRSPILNDTEIHRKVNQILARPEKITCMILPTDAGCELLSFDFRQISGMLFVGSLPYAASAVFEMIRLLDKKHRVILVEAQEPSGKPDNDIFLRIALLLDIIEAFADLQIPNETRLAMLAALFGCTLEQIKSRTSFFDSLPPLDIHNMASVLCRLMEIAGQFLIPEEKGKYDEKI